MKGYLFTFTLVAVLLPHSLPPLSLSLPPLSLSLSLTLSLSPVHTPQVHSLSLSPTSFCSSPALSLSHFTGTLIDPCFFELMIQLKSRMKIEKTYKQICRNLRVKVRRKPNKSLKSYHLTRSCEPVQGLKLPSHISQNIVFNNCMIPKITCFGINKLRN